MCYKIYNINFNLISYKIKNNKKLLKKKNANPRNNLIIKVKIKFKNYNYLVKKYFYL